MRIRNNKKHLVVNKEYSRLPYWTDDGYEDVQRQVSQKYIQDTYGAFAESENQLPYLSDADYQGLEYKYQDPQFPGIPDLNKDTAPKGTCYQLWLSLFGDATGAFIPTDSEWSALREYNKKCPLIYMPHTCCSQNIKINGPSSVKVNETAEYTISGGLTGCAYEMGATGGTMIGGTFYAPSTAGTAEVYVKPWMSSDQNKKCDFKVVTITDEGGCDGKIGYTTLQMSTGATQELTVTGSSGGTYSWATTSGSIVPTEGTSVTYTAPATNANCASNPTITLTCGGAVVDTITIAVNSYSAHDANAIETHTGYWCDVGVVSTVVHIYQNLYYCDGALNPNTYFSVNCHISAGKTNVGGPAPPCSEVWGEPTNLTCGAGGRPFSYFLGNPIVDLRYAWMLAAGCCPAQAL